MAELAFMKHDHTAGVMLPVEQAAALFSPFDLIVAKADGWAWGDQELAHPWFRIIRWSAVTVTQVETFTSRLLPDRDANGVPTTLEQSRANYIDLTDVRIPAALRTWWLDDSRATPIFVVPASFKIAPGALAKVRAKLADPNYIGLGQVAQGISA